MVLGGERSCPRYGCRGTLMRIWLTKGVNRSIEKKLEEQINGSAYLKVTVRSLQGLKALEEVGKFKVYLCRKCHHPRIDVF